MKHANTVALCAQGEMLREKAAQEAAELAKSEKEAQARAQQALWETTQVRARPRPYPCITATVNIMLSSCSGRLAAR